MNTYIAYFDETGDDGMSKYSYGFMNQPITNM